MADDFKVISTNVIPQVTEVRFYAETADHIGKHSELHAELPCVQNAIENNIKDPTLVEASYNDSFVFVDENTTRNGQPLRTPVKVVEGTSARIKTSYFADTKSSKIIWRKE